MFTAVVILLLGVWLVIKYAEALAAAYLAVKPLVDLRREKLEAIRLQRQIELEQLRQKAHEYELPWIDDDTRP